MNEKTFDLYGFGIAAVDELVEVDGYPEPGSKVPVLSRRLQGGGLCTTALVAAARLGLRCRYDGLLGRNDLSDFVRRGLAAEGIEFDEDIRYPEAQPYYSTVIIDRAAGERTILSGSEGVVAPAPEDVCEYRIAASRALFVDHLGPAGVARACAVARRHGVPVVADLERITDDLLPALELIDHLILPLRVAQDFTRMQAPQDAVAQLGRVARLCTAVTDGINGCWFIEGSGPEIRHQGAFEVAVADTTGCGDVFHGAYAAGILQGMAVAGAVRFASAAAALKAMRPGAQLGAPDRPSVVRFLAERDADTRG